MTHRRVGPFVLRRALIGLGALVVVLGCLEDASAHPPCEKAYGACVKACGDGQAQVYGFCESGVCCAPKDNAYTCESWGGACRDHCPEDTHATSFPAECPKHCCIPQLMRGMSCEKDEDCTFDSVGSCCQCGCPDNHPSPISRKGLEERLRRCTYVDCACGPDEPLIGSCPETKAHPHTAACVEHTCVLR